MIKVYINGTPGGTDGTAITSLTIKNLMTYVKGESEGYRKSYTAFPIFLREESGFTASSVKITGAWNDTSGKPLVLTSGSYSAWPTGSISLGTGTRDLNNVGQTNQMVYLMVNSDTSIASGTEIATISYVEN